MPCHAMVRRGIVANDGRFNLHLERVLLRGTRSPNTALLMLHNFEGKGKGATRQGAVQNKSLPNNQLFFSIQTDVNNNAWLVRVVKDNGGGKSA